MKKEKKKEKLEWQLQSFLRFTQTQLSDIAIANLKLNFKKISTTSKKSKD